MYRKVFHILILSYGLVYSQISSKEDSVALKNPLEEVVITGQIGSQTISQSVNNLILIFYSIMITFCRSKQLTNE